MPAGEIRLGLPPPPAFKPKVVVFQRVARLPTMAKAWSRVGDRLAKSLASAEGFRKLFDKGVGLNTALKSTSVAAISRIVPTLVALKAVARVLEKGVIAALRVAGDDPEYRKLAVASQRLASVTASAITPSLETGARSLGAALLRASTVGRVLGPMVDAAVARTALRVERAVLSTALAYVQKQVGGTAGAVPGGGMIGGGAFRSSNEGGVAVTVPGASISFTEPRAGVLDDTPSAVLKLAARLRLALARNEVLLRAARITLARQTGAPAIMLAQSAGRGAVAGAGGAPRDITRRAAASVARQVQQFTTGDVWRNAISAAQSATASMESSLRAAGEAMKASLTTNARLLGQRIPDSLAAAVTATDALNEAIALDLSMIAQIAASGAANARARHAAEMAGVAVTASILGGVAIAEGVVRAVAGDPHAALFFTSAGIYGLAMTLAGASGAGLLGEARRAERTAVDADGDDGALVFDARREADLYVNVRGWTRPEELAAEIAEAVKRGSSYAPGVAFVRAQDIRISRARKQKAIRDALAGIGEDYTDEAWATLVQNALGTIAPIVGTASRVIPRARREVQRARRKLGF